VKNDVTELIHNLKCSGWHHDLEGIGRCTSKTHVYRVPLGQRPQMHLGNESVDILANRERDGHRDGLGHIVPVEGDTDRTDCQTVDPRIAHGTDLDALQ
jgi:hypothetical protein